VNTQLWWYVARAGGIVAWALLAATVLWGLALSTRVLGSRPRPNWLLDLHRFLGGLALIFTGVHVTALVLDTYIPFGPTEVLVPLASTYRPGAVAWGVTALYLLAAVEITSLLRARLPRTLWRRTHVLSFPLYGFATLHGILAGSDSTGRLLYGSMLITSVLVLALTVGRLASIGLSPPPPRRPIPRTATDRDRLRGGRVHADAG
jgi:predicted ferric reductase